jgi:hypothetical protein
MAKSGQAVTMEVMGMRRIAKGLITVVIITVLVIGAIGCDTCDICGTYYGESEHGFQHYIKIHRDGTCYGTFFTGTWELHEEKIDGMSLKSLIISAPVFGVASYRVMDNMLIAPNGDRYRKSD